MSELRCQVVARGRREQVRLAVECGCSKHECKHIGMVMLNALSEM